MIPPDIKRCWDENVAFQQALLIAYDQIRDYEEKEFQAKIQGIK